MIWRAVGSTSIRRIGYDAGRRELGVEFLHGGAYVYSGVGEALFSEFLDADSKGGFFHDRVYGRYAYKKL